MNSRKAFFINELIKSIPGLMILILVVIWGRVLPVVSLSGEKSLLADIETLTKPSIGMGLVIFYALSAGLMNFQSYKEERNSRQIKNILLLPYKNTQRFIMKLISFIINISGVFLALSIYFLLVFIIEKASTGFYLMFLQTVLRDILWCLFLFLFFSFIQNFTGNSLFSTFTGYAVLTFYIFFLDFILSRNNIYFLADTSFFDRLYRFINLFDLSFIEMFFRVGLLSVLLFTASYILSKRYRYE
ncbi:MAG: hypothetical protein JXQ23_05505, partial [Clostridia bacterium]|nr:hypothetical protein [Clostridia bacterium]